MRGLLSVLTPCPWHLRRMGYLTELQGIRGRYRRWKARWQPHLDRSRAEILRASQRCAQRRKVVVLGSGWLLDVPIAELASTFREVVLVDLLHPISIRWHLRKFPNVQALASDVTGVVEHVWRIGHRQHVPLPTPCSTLFMDDPEVDLVVSLNLYSQLPVMLLHYLRSQKSQTEEALVAFARSLLVEHLAYLQRFQAEVVMICDTESVAVDREQHEVGRVSTVYNQAVPMTESEWYWDLAPSPEIDPNRSYRRRVVAVHLPRAGKVYQELEVNMAAPLAFRAVA